MCISEPSTNSFPSLPAPLETESKHLVCLPCRTRDGTVDSVLVLTAEEFCCNFSEDNNHA